MKIESKSTLKAEPGDGWNPEYLRKRLGRDYVEPRKAHSKGKARFKTDLFTGELRENV